jgi:hypothetical protein
MTESYDDKPNERCKRRQRPLLFRHFREGELSGNH